ncbi:MAG TPA: TolC family protein [Candidatus Paceibacterota bacterium]|nr:TolC family protein [Candidatus Paceibacterota bacterium]
MKRLISRATVFATGTALLIASTGGPASAQTNTWTPSTNSPSWITQPLSLVDALNITLRQNATISKAKNDLEATYGLVIQTRAITLPKLQTGTSRGASSFGSTDPGLTEKFPGSSGAFPHQSWNAGIQIVQSIYEGGRIGSALRAARLTKEQALLQYQTTVADTLLATRTAYYDILLAEQQITVNEASVNLLSRELEDQQRRYEAGTVPRFNVLRAEVAVANQRPNLIRARNSYRIAKNNLVNLLGYNLPREIWEDVPLQLTDKFDAEPYQIDLPGAIQRALEKRTELGALRKAEQLQQENIIQAKSGYKPSLQGFAGYEWRSSQYKFDLSQNVSDGWSVGAQLNWSIFDGLATRGKIIQARAQHDRAKTDLEDNARRIELEVRTSYSSFIEAREVLESQQKVQEEAEEALRLAKARTEAGTATQLDVLDAETSLTQARTTQVQALHDYAVARAKLERAMGLNLAPESAKP